MDYCTSVFRAETWKLYYLPFTHPTSTVRFMPGTDNKHEKQCLNQAEPGWLLPKSFLPGCTARPLFPVLLIRCGCVREPSDLWAPVMCDTSRPDPEHFLPLCQSKQVLKLAEPQDRTWDLDFCLEKSHPWQLATSVLDFLWARNKCLLH